MTNIPKNPFIIIDGSSYLFRAFYAMPPLTNSKGTPTGAIYGVINMLKNIMKEYHPSHMVVVFDTKGPNFRHNIFPEYKANRAKMPDELAVQIKPIHQIIQALGIPLLTMEGEEADDVIGSLAKQAEKTGCFSLISTGDKDMAQLVNKNITLINTMTNIILDEKGVEKKFEIPPSLIVDYLSIVGDSSDNIPGIEKVGPKTAIKWLKTYGSLDGIIANANNIKGKVGENLKNNLENLNLYRKLTTIKTDLDVNYTNSKFCIKDINFDELKALYTEYEFKNWLNSLKKEEEKEMEKEKLNTTDSIKLKNNKDINETNNNDSNASENKNYKTILSKKDLKDLIKNLKEAKIFAFDTETTDIDPFCAKLVGCSFSFTENEAYYIPFAHDYDNAPTQLDLTFVLDNLKVIFENEEKIIIGHHIKYDAEILSNYNIPIKCKLHDTMLLSYVLNSISGRHDLSSVAFRELNFSKLSFEDVTGKGAKQIPFNKVELSIASNYAGEDADYTLKLYNKMWPQIKANENLHYVYTNIEIPLIRVLQQMETYGILVDSNSLKNQSDYLTQKLSKLEKKAFDLAEAEFNLNSPKQLQEILFEKLQLPVLKKTPKGQPSTAEDALQELSNTYELPKIILEYRSLSKLKSTYTDKLPEKINKKTGRIHTSYHQAVTTTGRLSSSSPNLQNIPTRTEEGKKIRQAFIASPGNKILAADYSQIELRIMAHLSEDQTLIDIFKKGGDVHKVTASEVWSTPIEKVTSEQRRNAKAINFGLIYGMSPFGLAKQLGIDNTEAKEYINSYFNKFPGVMFYMEKTKHQAKEEGYIETMFGRRLYLPNINAKNPILRQAAQRAAINAPMQGAQADIIKLAMIEIDKWIKENHPEIKMLLQVHDELVFEVPESLLEIAKKEITKIMSNIVELSVDLAVSVGVSDNWEDAHS